MRLKSRLQPSKSRRLGGGNGGVRAAAAAPLLDTYTGAAAAYSLRKLRTGQTNAIRVRESGGDTELDIGFDGNDLDEAALLAHCGANDGFVVTVYEQSGNGTDESQSTAAAQPKIVSVGVVEKVNGKPAMVFDGVDDFLTTGGLTIGATGDNYVCVMASVGILTAATVDFGNNTVLLALTPGASATRKTVQQSFENTAVAARLQGGNTVFDAGDGKTQSVFMMGHLSTNSEFVGRLDGAALEVTSSGADDTLNVNVDSGYTIGLGGTGNYNGGGTPDYLEGKVQECIAWEQDNWSDAAAIETNINDHYSIY